MTTRFIELLTRGDVNIAASMIDKFLQQAQLGYEVEAGMEKLPYGKKMLNNLMKGPFTTRYYGTRQRLDVLQLALMPDSRILDESPVSEAAINCFNAALQTVLRSRGALKDSGESPFVSPEGYHI